MTVILSYYDCLENDFLNQLLLESKNNNLSHFLPLVNVPVTTGKSIISLKKDPGWG